MMLQYNIFLSVIVAVVAKRIESFESRDSRQKIHGQESNYCTYKFDI